MKIYSRPALVFVATLALALNPIQWLFGQSEVPVGKFSFNPSETSKPTEETKLEKATFGGGCFWCVEAVFQRVNGVKSIVSGYSGGSVVNPSYEAVCTGRTGHAEVCQITFDPSLVSFDDLLLIFFKTHDPTSLNKQGLDVGTQYRSVVFYEDEPQREATKKMIDHLMEDKVFVKKIVTEVSPLPDFYPAEAYHQNYFKLHPNERYCKSVIDPKVEKFEKLFKENSRLQKEREEKKKKK